MGAVIVIALFYTASIQWIALAIAAMTVVALVGLNRSETRSLAPYLLFGAVLWGALLASGLHATIAGVVLAMAVPSRTRINAQEFSAASRALLDDFDQSETGDLVVLTSRGQQEALDRLEIASAGVQAPLLKLEHSLHGAVSYFIMPLFALANAGVLLTGLTGVLMDRVTLGVVAGLVIGKPAGILAFSWLATRFQLADLPTGVGWRGLTGAACLAGIGFTMSLFVGSLAFDDGSLLTAAKVGVLVGSGIAGVLGWILVSRMNGDQGRGRRAADHASA
jgi:NhaA family Na+:H+ antiporter